MSGEYIGLRCVTCQKDSDTWWERGQNSIQILLDNWPMLKECLRLPPPLKVTLAGIPRSLGDVDYTEEVFAFIGKHYGHELQFLGEWQHTYPLIYPGQPNLGPIAGPMPIRIVEDRLYMRKDRPKEGIASQLGMVVAVADDGRMWDTSSPDEVARWERTEEWELVRTRPRDTGDHALVR
jgi:hypothetical protein